MKKGMALLALGIAAVTILSVTIIRIGVKKIENTAENLPQTYERHYAMITDSEDSDFWDKVYESAKAAGLESDAYVERFGEQLAVEYTRNELIELAIQASVDGIILPGDENQETIDLINQAVEANIPVVTVQSDSTGSLRQCFVGINYYNLGQDYGNLIAEILKEKSEAEKEDENGDSQTGIQILILMDETRMDTSQNLILLGIRETTESLLGETYPYVINTELVDNDGEFRSEESIRDIFLNWSDLPDIIVCLNEVNTRCVYQAAVDYNKVGTVQILGYYDSESVVDAVAKNIVYATIAPDTDQIGQDCVTALNEYVQTGYTNTYMTVDTTLIRAGEAVKLLDEE